MFQFSRPAFWTIAVLLGAFSLPVSLAAQAPTGEPTRSLRLSVATFVGYDSDISHASVDAAAAPSASHAGVRTTLGYQLRTDKVAFSTSGAADARHYRTEMPLQATSFSGETALSASVTSRLNVSASFYTMYSPRFVFSLMPQANDIELNLAPALDYGVSAAKMLSHAASANARLQVSRRGFLTATASRGSQRLLDQNYNVTTHSYGGGYSHSATRYTTLRLGYREQVSHYPSPTGASNQYTYRILDAGVNYSRPLSISRRTTMSVSTGSAAYANTTETFYTVTATASLNHEINRTWAANVVYSRGLSVVVGFPEPFFTDAVTATIQGRLARQVTLVASTGLSNGHVGLGSATNNYDSVQATARLEWTVKSERIGVYGNYFYHAYQFDQPPVSVTPIPHQVNRNGVSAGLIFRFPLLKERTPSVTR